MRTLAILCKSISAIYLYETGAAPKLCYFQRDDQVFAGSQLLNCSFIADDIKTCQAAGKKVTLSIGGAGAGGGTADSAFADQIWDLFLGGSSSTRPFGDAILDG